MTIDTQKLRHMASRLSITNDDDVSAALKSAAGHIDAQAAEIERLRHALGLAEKALLEAEPLVGGGDDEINLEPAILTARAALSGEPT